MEMPQFSSPEEELKYLRERVAHNEQQFWQEATPVKQETAISQSLHEYAKVDPGAALAEHLIFDNPQFESVVGHIGKLEHREKMRELYEILKEKGVLSSIAVARALNSPHIEDDFHRVLVEYVRTGAIVPGLDKEKVVNRALHMTVFDVILPNAGARVEEEIPRFQDAIAAMERFYVGMMPSDPDHAKGYGPFAFELALANFSNDLIFVIAVPNELSDLFLKQILAVFPTARIEENPGDYNLFNEFGVSACSMAVNTDNFIYPVLSSDEAENDPLKVIINAFAKIERDGEGAAVQFVVLPDPDRLDSRMRHAVGEINKGVALSHATNIPLTFSGEAVKALGNFFKTIVNNEKKEKEKEKTEKHLDNKAAHAIEMIEEKLKHSLVRVNLRIVASAATRDRAESILSSIESAFNQFHRAEGNGIKFKRQEGGAGQRLLHEFTFRLPNDPAETLIMNAKELATMYHLPLTVTQKEAPHLKTLKAATAPSPLDISPAGVLLGINGHRGEKREIRMSKPDRLRHFYVIGQTGTGKTTLLKNMILEDIKNGDGVCYIHPEQKIFVVNELLSIFKKLYSAVPESMGPAFEQYFRNATMLVMEDVETGNTLLEISRVLADAKFRELKLSRCKNPIVVQFWREIAMKTSGEAGLANMTPYITNKFDVFLSNDVMRPIIAQETSSFHFRDIMDNKKILLVNLAKGKLGDINSNLLGLILVGKILMAALSRVDSFGKQLPDFYLYIDEFQNITTDSISSILSEARKYGLGLTIAHQFIAQLEEGIKDSVFGNVGSMAVFRVGADDAQFLETQFAPIFTATDMLKIDNHNAYLKMLVNGRPVPPFNIETMAPSHGTPEIIDQLKQLSYLKFGRDRATVDGAIMKKYAAASQSATAVAPTSKLVSMSTSSTPPELRVGSGTSLGQALGQLGVTPQAVPASSLGQSATPVQAPHVPIAQQYPQHPIATPDTMTSPLATPPQEPPAPSSPFVA